MLIPRRAKCGTRNRHGGRDVSLAEVRRLVVAPLAMNERHRQRLLNLAQRLARVRALGDEYAGIELSEYVTAAMERHAVVS